VRGATYRIEGRKLILEIDLDSNLGNSGTGRSVVVAKNDDSLEHVETPEIADRSYYIRLLAGYKEVKASEEAA
jgi:hypothetical protein